jgi:hypothetical protein
VLGFLDCWGFCWAGTAGAGTDFGDGVEAGAGEAGLGLGDPVADVGELRSKGLKPKPAE